jgi:hypothetical protein
MEMEGVDASSVGIVTIKLDAAFLVDVHLDGMSPVEGNLMLRHIYETLELRVGERLASAMTDFQLDEFEILIDERDEEGAYTWLRTNFPYYRELVEEELELLRTEVRQMAPAIRLLGGWGR